MRPCLNDAVFGDYVYLPCLSCCIKTASKGYREERTSNEFPATYTTSSSLSPFRACPMFDSWRSSWRANDDQVFGHGRSATEVVVHAAEHSNSINSPAARSPQANWHKSNVVTVPVVRRRRPAAIRSHGLWSLWPDRVQVRVQIQFQTTLSGSKGWVRTVLAVRRKYVNFVTFITLLNF